MDHGDRERPYHLSGWILFLACAFLFLFTAVKNGDIILALAGVLFLAGCVAFLVPLLRKGRKSQDS